MQSHIRPPPQGKIFYLAVWAGSVIIGVDFAFILLATDPQKRTVFSDVFSPIVDFLVSIVLFVTARQFAGRSKRLAIAWGMIGLSVLSFAAGDITWGILELGFKEQPFPSLADGFYLTYYPFLLTGVLLLPDKAASVGEKINKALDIGIVMVAAVLGFWNYLLGPTISSSAGSSFVEQAILLAYPVGDLALLYALLIIINNRSEQLDETSVLLFGASLLITIVADSIYSYQALLGTYVSGTVLDISWVASILLIGLAGMSQWAAFESTGGTRQSQIGRGLPGRLRRTGPYLPYLWLIAAYILLVRSEQIPVAMSFFTLSLGVAVIIGLVVIRQVIALSTNSKLNLQLLKAMDSLKSQAAELEKTNLELNSEIAERKRVEEKLSHDALHDAMTGLANRVLFMDRLGQAIEYNKRRAEYSFAVLFIDLDQFKVINDSLGHLQGDQLLISVGKRLKGSLRSSDTVARFGGDEFAVLLESTGDRNSALLVAQKIQEALKPPFNLGGHEIYVTASMGVVTDLSVYTHPEEVLRDADIAMYQAKALGKERFEVFHAEMRNQLYSRLALENELREGLKNREFRIHYQPIVSLKSNKVISLEALVRWQHPRRGLLLPDAFLPIAEETGLILPLGDWILNEACSQLYAWHRRYPQLQDTSVSVNISNKQFAQSDLVEKVARALDASGLKAEHLKLEITENVLISNYATANEAFTQLRNLGVQLQIDDFGSGYSALGYLQHFPISVIKIDRTFINDIGKGSRSTKLVRAMVSMAHELGMEIVAEGIETSEQLNELKNLSCNLGQGFHLVKPLDKEAMEKFMGSQ